MTETGEENASQLNRVIRPLLLSVIVAVAIYASAVLIVGYREVATAAARLTWAHWMLLLSLSLFNYLVRFLRWHWYLQILGHRIPVLRHLAYYLAGFALTTTPGKSGEMIRSLYLKSHRVGYTESLATFLAERLLDLLTLVPMALLAALYFDGYEWLVWVVMIFIALALGIVNNPKTSQVLLRATARIPSEKVRQLAGQFGAILESAANLLRTRALYLGFLGGVLAWLAEGVALYYILDFLGLDVSLPVAVGIFSLAVLTGAVSIIPGGLGSSEAVMVLLLVLVGVNMSDAVAATFISSVSCLWFAVAIGVLAISILQLEKRPAN